MDFTEIHRLLDEATDGAVYAATFICKQNGWTPRAMVQTHLDGMPYGEMRLILYGIDPKTEIVKYFDTARLPEGEAQTTGWGLKLYELTNGVRRGLRETRAGLDQMDAEVDA